MNVFFCLLFKKMYNKTIIEFGFRMISCSTSSNNCIITAVARWRFRRENTFAGSWPSTLLEGGVGVDVFVLSTFWNTHIFRDWLRSLLENYNHFYVFSIIRIYYYYYYFFLTSWIFIPLVTRFLVTPLLVTALLCLVTPAEVKWNGNWNTATMMYIIFFSCRLHDHLSKDAPVKGAISFHLHLLTTSDRMWQLLVYYG